MEVVPIEFDDNVIGSPFALVWARLGGRRICLNLTNAVAGWVYDQLCDIASEQRPATEQESELFLNVLARAGIVLL